MTSTAKWDFVIKSAEEVKERGLGAWYAILIDDVNSYNGKTSSDYIAEGCLVVSEKQFHDLIAAHEQSICGDWKEITEDEYEYALNVLPPEKYTNGGFFIGEATTGSIYGFYQRYNGKYYTSLQDICSDRASILESLKKYVEA